MSIKNFFCRSDSILFDFGFIFANMNEARYNLRSNRGACRIPIQLQLASDADFLAVAGNGATSPPPGQVGFTDLSDSRSDIDM